MAENTLNDNKPKEEKKAKKLSISKLTAKFWNKEWADKSLPVIILLSCLSIVYIYVVHKHVKKLNEIQFLKNENQELRSELIAIQTDLMTRSKQSEVAKKVSAKGLKETRKAPYKIYKKSK
jgi:hypothetical protein